MEPIYLFGHCVFCLRKETTKNEISSEKFIGAVTSSIPLEVANKVTKHFLTSIGRDGWEGFVEPPTICSICAVHVRRIHQLLNDLSETTSAIQTAIKWAGFEGRVGDFLTKLRASSGNVVVKRSTVKFFLQLGHLEVQKEESQLGTSFASEDKDPPEGKKEESCEEENQEIQDIDDSGVQNSDDAGDSDDDYVEEEEAGSSQSDTDSESEKPVRSENPSDANKGEVPRASYRGKRVQCDYCHDRIPIMDLRCHLRTHVGDFAVECPNPSCYWAYTTTAKLKSHLKQCNAKGQEGSSSSGVNLDTCQLCGLEASSQRSLRNHLVTIHESATSKVLHCPVANCSEEFTHRQTVLCHINQKHSERPEPLSGTKPVSILLQKCPDSACNKNNRNGSMSQHLVDDHGIPVESLVSCRYCPFVYLDHQSLVDHLCVHVKHGDPVFCDICTGQEFKFAGMRDLRQHYFEIHQVGELHRCQHCDKSSLSLLDITAHRRHVHKLDRNGKPIHRVKCDLCPEHVTREYFDPKVLLKHKINEHGAEPFRCQFCDKTFSLQSRCHEHEMEHKGIVKPKPGPFKCDIPGCGKEYSSRRTLLNHKKSILHMGKTNTELCVECGKWFSNKKSLSVHMKIEHAAEKVLFVCDQCGAKFKTKGNLKQHTEGVHNNTSLRECHICKRRFQKRTALARHLAHLKPDGTCLGEKNFKHDWRKRRQEKLERERASQQLNS